MAQGVWRRRKYPTCHWHFVSWWQWSLGLTVDWLAPNLEVHLPFGFFRVGWEYVLNCVGGGRWEWIPEDAGEGGRSAEGERRERVIAVQHGPFTSAVEGHQGQRDSEMAAATSRDAVKTESAFGRGGLPPS